MTKTTAEPVKRESWEHPSEAGFTLEGKFSADGSGVNRALTHLIRKWTNARCRSALTPAQVAAELARSPFAYRFSGWIENWSQREQWTCYTQAPGVLLTAPQCELSAQSAIIHQPEVRRMNGLDVHRGPASGVR